MTRILLIDDHALFRESLARLLNQENGLQVTGQGATVEEALNHLEREEYDLVLLDYELGDRRANEVVAREQERGRQHRIIIVTVGLTLAEVRQLRNKGVGGIFLKNNEPEMLLAAIRAVLAGHTYFDPQYASTPEEPVAPVFRKVRFTERDREVLRAVFEGLANKEIADRLGVSESAIKASLQQLFSKTGVRTRSQLVRVALEQHRRELLEASQPVQG
jgi:two-component system, NarL family, nitrate/nitrite response regulator NarL